MQIPISERSRRFGYLIWPRRLDSEIARELQDRQRIRVVLEGKEMGEKLIDWRHRRISLGPKQTRAIAMTATTFEALVDGEGVLNIQIR